MSNGKVENLFFQSLRRKQIIAGVISFAVFVSIISLVLFEGTKKTVTLNADGQVTEIKTHAHTVEELLSDQEIKAASHDLVTPSVNTPIKQGLEIRWEQAKQVAIQIDQEEQKVWTLADTVGDVLEEAGIEPAEHDSVEPDLQEPIAENESITVQKAFQVSLNDGGKEKSVWSTSTTVADFLKRENIQLNEEDRLNRKADGFVKPGSIVEVVRVEKVTDVVEEPADFAVETRKDSSLLKGRKKVLQPGEKGTVSREFEVVKENGKEVSRKLLAEKTIKEPKKKVVAVGSKVVVADASSRKNAGYVGVSRNSSPPAGGKEFYVTATAYTAQCNGCSGITRTGINLNANPNLKLIAVDPSVIPLGSKVWVEGYGYAVAGDTGGAIKGNRIDLHMATKTQAYNFGRRQVKMKIIN